MNPFKIIADIVNELISAFSKTVTTPAPAVDKPADPGPGPKDNITTPIISIGQSSLVSSPVNPIDDFIRSQHAIIMGRQISDTALKYWKNQYQKFSSEGKSEDWIKKYIISYFTGARKTEV